MDSILGQMYVCCVCDIDLCIDGRQSTFTKNEQAWISF